MGYRLSKIYTRTGDKGETALGDGRRVPKDHPRIEAIGEVDSLNSQLGLLLAGLAEQGLSEVSAVLAPCQHRLFDLGGELAMPSYQALNMAEVERLEAAIDVWNEELGPLKNFILPSGSALVAALCILAAAYVGETVAVISLLCVAMFFIRWCGMYWCLPAIIGGPSRTGVLGGTMNFCGNMAGVLVPIVIGLIVQFTGDYFFALIFFVAAAVLIAVFSSLIDYRERQF